MKSPLPILFIALMAAAPLAATAQIHGGNGAVRCSVTDMDSFNAFIATQPTVVEFRAAYSCLALVLPGDIATREIRPDNSRYFARMDTFGRITGGYFQ